MNSKDRKQLELLPNVEAHAEPMTPELLNRIRQLPTLSRAWKQAQDVTVIQDKFVCEVLDMDQSQWTKIRSGMFNPPSDERFIQYSKIVQNHVVLAWHCEAEGFDFFSLRPHKSSLERENEELKQDLAVHKRAMKLMMEAQK